MTALQHFLLLLQKKTLAKENEPGGSSIFLPDHLEPTRKTASVFLTFSREIWWNSKLRMHQRRLPMAQGPNRGRDAGPKGLRGCERCILRSTLKSVINPLRHLLTQMPPPLTAQGVARGGFGGLRRIRTASQMMNARPIYCNHSNAATHKFGVP